MPETNRQLRQPAAHHPSGLAHVLVYGTLRRGGSNDIRRLLPAPVWVGEAVVAGTLYDLGSYPGLRLDGAGPVRAEVYRIEPADERVLDQLEEVWPEPSGEYDKRRIAADVRGPGGQWQRLDCLVYELAPAFCRGRAAIASGDWLEWLRGPRAAPPARAGGQNRK